MRTRVDLMENDKLINPYYKPENEVKVTKTLAKEKEKSHMALKQKLITDFTLKTKTGNPLITSSSLPNLSIRDKKNPTFVRKENRGFNYCNNPRCRFSKTGDIKCTYTGETFTCMTNVSCRSYNVIYCITCTKCLKQYVGQTSNSIRDRFQGNFSDISRDDNDKSIPLHFNSKEHMGTKDMKISVLEYIRKSLKSQQAMQIRFRREKHWTYTLHTFSPIGLNMENPKEFKLKKNEP